MSTPLSLLYESLLNHSSSVGSNYSGFGNSSSSSFFFSSFPSANPRELFPHNVADLERSDDDNLTRSRNSFKFLVRGVLLTAVSLFGLAGNAVAISVLARPGMRRSSFATLLIGLSSFDILYLLIGVAIFGLPALSPAYASSVYVRILPVGFGLGHVGRVGSVFVTMSVTIERYFAIVHPLRYFSQKKHLLLGSTVAAVLFNAPKFFELETKILKDADTTVVSGTALRLDSSYLTNYIFWSKFVFVEIVPYITIIVLNSLIARKIWKSEEFRRSFKGHQHSVCNREIKNTARRRETNLGHVLISISVLFVLCQSIKIIPEMYEVIFCRFGAERDLMKCPTTKWMESVIDVSHLLLAVNSSSNFILYIWRGKKFRETLAASLYRIPGYGVHGSVNVASAAAAATNSDCPLDGRTRRDVLQDQQNRDAGTNTFSWNVKMGDGKDFKIVSRFTCAVVVGETRV